MNKVMDRLKFKVQFDKNLILFLIILTIVGIISGSFFVTILSTNDFDLISGHLNAFLDNVQNNKIDYLLVLKNNLITNLIYVVVIWLLGISVIGLPIILIMYFSKAFILGFSIGSIISVFKLKGILFSLVYVFPGQVISLISLIILTMYAMSFSFKLIHVIISKKNINFKIIINKYFKIFLFALGIIIIMNLYDTYLMPNIVKSIITFIR